MSLVVIGLGSVLAIVAGIFGNWIVALFQPRRPVDEQR